MKNAFVWAAVFGSWIVAVAACVADDPTTNASQSGDDAGGDGSFGDGSLGDGSATDGNVGDAACTICGSSCVDLDTSAANCGACGKACKTGISCGSGKCADQVVSAAPGDSASCVLLANGDVWCWGDDQGGELGASAGTERCFGGPFAAMVDAADTPCRVAPAKVAGLPAAKQICGGSKYFCVLANDDSAWCWGRDDSHQLGHTTADPDAGTSLASSSRTPSQVSAISSLSQITCGEDFACALTKSGSIYCWGNNTFANLGSLPDAGPGPSSGTPVLIGGVPAASEISASDHVCAVSSDHHVWCWGSASLGALGHAETQGCTSTAGSLCQPIPAVIVNDAQGHAFDGIDHVRAGALGTCAHKSDGTVWCWGNNLSGQLGNGSNDSYPGGAHPLAVGVSGVGNSAAAFDLHGATGYVISTSGKVIDWGEDIFGEIGSGALSGGGRSACQPLINYGGCLDTPAENTELADMKSVFAGPGMALGIKADNSVWTWGLNQTGQLGHSTQSDAGDVACGSADLLQQSYCNPTPSRVVGLP